MFIGHAIAQRLRERLPDLRDVRLIDEIEDRDTEPKQTPAAQVLLHSMRPDTALQPAQLRIPLQQLWLVTLVVHSARRAPDRIATQIGPLVPACINSLHGWVPEGCVRPLGWVPGPRPDYRAKHSLYPLMFRAQLATSG
jgi:hypothetical protein